MKERSQCAARYTFGRISISCIRRPGHGRDHEGRIPGGTIKWKRTLTEDDVCHARILGVDIVPADRPKVNG